MEDPVEPSEVQGQDEPRPASHLVGLHLDGPPIQRLHLTLLSRRESPHFKVLLMFELGQATKRKFRERKLAIFMEISLE